MEQWKTIEDYPDYEVSSFGRVRSKDRKITQLGHKNYYERVMRGKVLQPRRQNAGYYVVQLCMNGKKKAVTIHRLVAAAFIAGNGNDVNHKDGNKTNNNVENLEWVTRSENITHAYRTLGHPKRCKAVVCIDTGEEFASIKEAAQAKGVNPVSIGHNIKGRNKTAGGYTWCLK